MSSQGAHEAARLWTMRLYLNLLGAIVARDAWTEAVAFAYEVQWTQGQVRLWGMSL